MYFKFCNLKYFSNYTIQKYIFGLYTLKIHFRLYNLNIF